MTMAGIVSGLLQGQSKMAAEKLIERTKGRWHLILPALGIPSSFLTGRHGPCPVCGGVDRFRFDNSQNNGTWICGKNCGAGDGVELVRRFFACDFYSAALKVESVLAGNFTPEPAIAVVHQKPEIDTAESKRRCSLVWEEASPITKGDPAWLYFQKRGITLTPDHGRYLRHHHRLVYSQDGKTALLPAVVAAVLDPRGDGINILRVYLDRHGNKADVGAPKKLMAGSFPAGSAIRLGQAAPKMGVAEGIENALAASILFDIPVWSAVTAGGLKRWEPPSVAREVSVFGDNDLNGAGQGAAEALAVRLRSQGLTVTIRIPGLAGEDWNDLVLTRVSAGFIRRSPLRASQHIGTLDLQRTPP